MKAISRKDIYTRSLLAEAIKEQDWNDRDENNEVRVKVATDWALEAILESSSATKLLLSVLCEMQTRKIEGAEMSDKYIFSQLNDIADIVKNYTSVGVVD
jgi:hypothetical protein